MSSKSDSTDNQRRFKRGKNPASLANLRPFVKGRSGNPEGRPTKDCSITSIIKAELDQKVPRDKDGRTWRQMLADALRVGALRDPALMRELLNRMEGKVPQPLVGEEGGAIKHEHQLAVIVKTEAEKKSLEELGKPE